MTRSSTPIIINREIAALIRDIKISDDELASILEHWQFDSNNEVSMGYAEPGKQTAVASAFGTSANHELAQQPGKQTLADTQASAAPMSATLSSANPPRKGLSDRDRSILERNYQGRVLAAEDKHTAAITQIRAKLLSLKKEEAGLLFAIVDNVVFGMAGLGIKLAVKSLLAIGATEAALGEARIVGAHIAHEEMSEVTAGELEAMVGGGIDTAKEATKEPLVKATHPDEESPSGDFLDKLSERTAMWYQGMRENPTAYASDAQLLALFESFSAIHHTIAAYRAQIDQQLARFLGSHASHIGREGAVGQRENRVAWLVHGGDRQLVYVSKEFEVGAVLAAHGRTGDRDTPERAGPEESFDAKIPGHLGFVGFVEPDLVQAALASHEAAWKTPPKSYDWDLILGRQS
jgi:hypothetical protein